MVVVVAAVLRGRVGGRGRVAAELVEGLEEQGRRKERQMDSLTRSKGVDFVHFMVGPAYRIRRGGCARASSASPRTRHRFGLDTRGVSHLGRIRSI